MAGGSRAREAHAPGDRRGPNIVIAAFARAKLLGLKILTIDARVVLASADSPPDVGSAAARARVVTPVPVSPRRAGMRADLAYAVRLLEEGSRSLDEVRGMGTLTSKSAE
jgi:hypothetical protein